jgi:hypothetical protein
MLVKLMFCIGLDSYLRSHFFLEITAIASFLADLLW